MKQIIARQSQIHTCEVNPNFLSKVALKYVNVFEGNFQINTVLDIQLFQ